MKKKEYIEKMANLIMNRVRFHAPIVYEEEIDFDLLEVIGLDASLPIFKLEKTLTELLADAFLLAQKQVSFNLITTVQPSCKKKQYQALKNFVYIKEEELGYGLLSTINALNINYKSDSQFAKEIEEDYMKVNDDYINLSYKEFYLHKKAVDNGINYEIKEFILNGKNVIVDFLNPHTEKGQISFEINLPLPRGYYLFERESNAIKIINLTSKESAYFNFTCKNAKFLFSSISGVESSTHACIHMKVTISLLGQEKKRLYFNFGEHKYIFTSPKDMDEFFEISQHKMHEIFDIKVRTKNQTFDNEFNVYMPQKIWLSWLNWSVNEEIENLYLKMKNQLIKKTEKGYQICEENKDLKEVKCYLNSGYKRVFIVPGNQRYILADQTKYFNFTCVTKDIFQKNDEIYLSFGS